MKAHVVAAGEELRKLDDAELATLAKERTERAIRAMRAMHAEPN